MTQRTAAQAIKVVAECIDQVVKDKGIVHEDAVWEATEMALDGVSPEVIVETLKQPVVKRYRPRGGWRAR